MTLKSQLATLKRDISKYEQRLDDADERLATAQLHVQSLRSELVELTTWDCIRTILAQRKAGESGLACFRRLSMEWALDAANGDPSRTATLLGVTERGLRFWKAKIRQGELVGAE